MSLSRHETRAGLTGKVVVGMHTPGPDEMTIQEIEGKRQLIWDDSTNEEYLERVKLKAREKAKEILMLAELEAEALRASATHEGYEEGLVKAQAELDLHVQTMSAQVEGILAQIGAQGSTIYQSRREDIISLIKLAVEKTINLELSENRVASLQALMTEALERIESQRQIAIKCAPEDAEELDAFVRSIQDRNPALKYWSVKGDPAIAEGGIVLEAAEGRVDNTIASRWQGVEEVLNQLAGQVASDGTEG